MYIIFERYLDSHKGEFLNYTSNIQGKFTKNP